MESSTVPRNPIGLWLGPAAGAIVPWALAVAGRPWPHALTQLVVACSLTLLLALAARAATRAFRAELARSRPLAWALAALVALSVAVHFAGLSFEIGRGYYADEGIYRSTAQRIVAGDPIPRSLIYGHLPFYLASWSLWLRRLFVAPTSWLVATFSSLGPGQEVSWMLIRAWSGLFGALTVLPVIGVARRILDSGTSAPGAGRSDVSPQLAGLLAGALIVASNLYNEVTHLFISDVPAAFFATLALYFSARLLSRETTRDYLLAGVASGLAGGSKYPAAIVVVAIAAVWLVWRWRERRWRWGLLLAAAAATVTLVAVMPALVVHLERTLSTGRGRNLLFGMRQYSGAGWIGVVKDSNVHWYLDRLRDSFGAGALLLGGLGLFALDSGNRRRWLTVATFPFVYGALLLSMTVAVRRNLLPFLPAASALLGVGCASAAAWLAHTSRRPRLAPVLGALVTLVALAAPLVAIVQQSIGYSSAGTRALTEQWILEHLPPGAGVVKEAYTPDFEGPFDVHQTRFLPRVDRALLRSGRFDFVLLAATGYSRFLDPENAGTEARRAQGAVYRELLRLPEVFAIDGSATRIGPGFTLRKLEQPDTPFLERRHFVAKEAAVSHWKLRADGNATLAYTAVPQSAAFRERLKAGRYELVLDGDALEGGRIDAYSIENAPLAALVVGRDPLRFELDLSQRVFLKVELPPGGRLRGLTLSPQP